MRKKNRIRKSNFTHWKWLLSKILEKRKETRHGIMSIWKTVGYIAAQAIFRLIGSGKSRNSSWQQMWTMTEHRKPTKMETKNVLSVPQKKTIGLYWKRKLKQKFTQATKPLENLFTIRSLQIQTKKSLVNWFGRLNENSTKTNCAKYWRNRKNFMRNCAMKNYMLLVVKNYTRQMRHIVIAFQTATSPICSSMISFSTNARWKVKNHWLRIAHTNHDLTRTVKNIRWNASPNLILYFRNFGCGSLYKICVSTSGKKRFKIISWIYSESLPPKNFKSMSILQRSCLHRKKTT